MKGMKKVLAVAIILGLFLGGCSRQTGADLGESPAMTQQESIAGTGGDTAGEAVPDGEYVYDYQVSQEPIPKEIADLGGPCQGTIHAFPYQIKIGLTQRMLEEDPELKAEVEKRIPEVEAQLSEEIGGEFRVDGVIIYDEWDWAWVCTELETGYQFALDYLNSQYLYQSKEMDGLRSENTLYTEEYYVQEDSRIGAPKYDQFIEEIFEDCYYKVWVRHMHEGKEYSIISISIIRYTDEEVDRREEQLKIMKLWERIQALDESAAYTIGLYYCSDDYMEVIENKYENGLCYDSFNSSEEEGIAELIERGELSACLRYNSIFDSENKVNLDTLLSAYQNGTYRENKIWPYWIDSK